MRESHGPVRRRRRGTSLSTIVRQGPTEVKGSSGFPVLIHLTLGCGKLLVARLALTWLPRHERAMRRFEAPSPAGDRIQGTGKTGRRVTSKKLSAANVALVSAIVACLVALLQSNMAGPIYPLWQENLHFSPGVINILFAVYPAGVLIALFGVMRVLRRFTWRATLIASVVTGIAAALLSVVARDPWVLGLSRYTCGLSVGIVLSTGASTITATLERRGIRGAARLAAIIISAGFACGALFAGLIADNLPAPTILVWKIEFVALMAALVYLIVDPHLKTIDDYPRDRVANGDSDTALHPMLPAGQRRSAMATATWVFVACGISCAVFQSIGSAYLKGLLGANSATFSGLLVFLVFGSAFAGQLLMSTAHARQQAWTALVAGASGAVLLLFGVLTESVIALFFAAALSGGSQGLGQAVGFTLARQTTELDRLPSRLSMLNVLAYGTAGGGILITTPLVNHAGVSVAIGALATAVLLLTIVAVTRMLQHQETLTHSPAFEPHHLEEPV